MVKDSPMPTNTLDNQELAVQTPETSPDVISRQTQERALAATETEETDKLLEHFSLHNLTSTRGSILYQVQSHDIEIGGRHWEDTKMPQPLEQIPEQKLIFKILQNPLNDIKRIRQRQSLIESLYSFPGLDASVEQKQGCYNICEGFDYIFALIQIDEYNRSMALYSYKHGNHPSAEAAVTRGIELIKEGKVFLEQLIASLEESQNPFVKKVVEELKNLLSTISGITKEYIDATDYSDLEKELGQAAQKAKSTIKNAGVFLEFAKLARDEGYGKAEYDPNQPYTYSQGWNPLRKKEEEVLNDSPAPHQTVVYSGPNQSGKSHSGLKREFMIQAQAQSFGYGAFTEGNFDIRDSFHYIDRATTDHRHNLSAFGKEVEGRNRAIESLGEKPFICIDEGWSTTSETDQYKLLVGEVLFLRSKRAKLHLATHNGKAIARLHEQDQETGVYNFQTTTDEKGEPIYSRKLRQGPDDSNALAVARYIGLPLNLVDTAEKYLSGDEIEAVPPKGTYRKLKEYKEAKREKLKGKPASPAECIGILRPGEYREDKASKVLRLLSEDNDFKVPPKGLPRIQAPNVKISGWEPGVEKGASNFIFSALTELKAPKPKQTVERRGMFTELAKNDKYREVAEITEMALRQIKFLEKMQYISRQLMQFNLSLCPFEHHSPSGIDGIDAAITFLELNAKLLGDDFALKKELEKARTLREAYRLATDTVDSRSIDEICAITDRIGSEAVNDPKIRDLFFKVATDEPDDDRWEPGVLTISRLEQYLWWANDKDCMRKYDDADYKKLQQSSRKFTRGTQNVIQDPEQKKADINKIIEKFGEDEPEKWSDKITVNRVRALRDRIIRLLKTDGWNEELRHSHSVCGDTIMAMLAAQRELQIDDPQICALAGKEQSQSSIYNYLHDEASEATRSWYLNQKIPPITIFEADLASTRPEIKKLLDFHIKQESNDPLWSRDRENDWVGSKIYTALVVDILADPEDHVRKLIDLLRSYEAVHLHQLANYLEEVTIRSFFRTPLHISATDDKARRRHSAYDGEKDEPVDFSSVPLIHGPTLVKRIQDIFERQAGKSYKKVQELSKRGALLRAQFADAEQAQQVQEIVRVYKAMTTSDFARVADSNRNSVGSIITNFYFLKKGKANRYHQKLSKNSRYHKQYISRLNRDNVFEILQEFIENEIKGSPELEKALEFDRQMRQIGEEALQIARKESIKIGKEHELPAVLRGDVSHLAYKLQQRIRQTTGLEVERGPYTQSIRGTLYGINGIFLMGHTIAKDQHPPVKFNDTGEFSMPGMWSLGMEKEKQVPNTLAFAPNERVKILSGPNMGGKTHLEKALDLGIPWALATGHAPTSEPATMPLTDRVVYLDRVTSREDIDLGAFGNEAGKWATYMQEHTARPEGQDLTVLGVVDEAFSTTSPKYQNALTYSLAVESIKRGDRVILAGHTHEAFNRLLTEHGDHVEAHHFTWHFDESVEEGEERIVLDHKLEPGHAESRGVDVAEALGLHPDIIKFARLVN